MRGGDGRMLDRYLYPIWPFFVDENNQIDWVIVLFQSVPFHPRDWPIHNTIMKGIKLKVDGILGQWQTSFSPFFLFRTNRQCHLKSCPSCNGMPRKFQHNGGKRSACKNKNNQAHAIENRCYPLALDWAVPFRPVSHRLKCHWPATTTLRGGIYQGAWEIVKLKKFHSFPFYLSGPYVGGCRRWNGKLPRNWTGSSTHVLGGSADRDYSQQLFHALSPNVNENIYLLNNSGFRSPPHFWKKTPFDVVWNRLRSCVL